MALAAAVPALAVGDANHRAGPITMARLANLEPAPVGAYEISDYVFGGYRGGFKGPHHADLNPQRAVVIAWRDHPYRFVFWHEASYCPFFELRSGAGLSYQFFEGNDGWAELFNDWGRQERNSFVDVVEAGPKRVWIHWTYFGVNVERGERAFRGSEDFWAYPNGLILRRQTYRTLKPGDPRGYAREPIEMIAMAPVGRFWYDVLAAGRVAGSSHALAVLDPFSQARYDVFWTRRPGTLWKAVPARTGSPWKELDDSRGVILAVPLRDGTPFCVFGDASGFRHEFTRIKEHSFRDTGGHGWVANTWDHWPVGWINTQAHDGDAESLARYPNHFSPAGMDLWSLSNEDSERGVYYSLLGVGGADLEPLRGLARAWLEAPENARRPERLHPPR